MRRTCLVIFSLNVLANLSAQIEIKNFEYSFLEDVIFFVGYNNRLYQVNTLERKYVDITENLTIEATGYYLLKFPLQGQEPILKQGMEYYLICGSNQLFYLNDLERIMQPQKSNEDTFIGSISAASFLIEKTTKGNIEYDPTNLLSRFFTTDQEFRYELIPSALPWATKGDDLTKASLELNTKFKTTGLIFLNGYVDLQNQSLYRKNSRVKEIEIADTQTGHKINTILSDSIQYQEVPLPFNSDSLRIRILSVYPGSKYQDICLSAIVPFFSEEISKKSKAFRTNETVLKNGTFLKTYSKVRKF